MPTGSNTELKRRRAAIAAVNFDYAAQPKRRIHTCNVCEGRELVSIARHDRYGFDASFSVCSQCGLIALNPVMEMEAYASFYASVYRPLVSAYHGRVIDATTIQPGQQVYAKEVRDFIGKPRIQLRRILDVGGSTGIVANQLTQEFDAAAVVVDPAPPEIDSARRLGLSTFTGLVEDFDGTPGSFDLAIVGQTIDHVLDVSGTLTKIHNLLGPKGFLFIDIVDTRFVWRQSGALSSALKIDHPYAFVDESAEFALARHGFGVTRKERSVDGHLIRYLCVPVMPQPELRPNRSTVKDLIDEILAQPAV